MARYNRYDCRVERGAGREAAGKDSRGAMNADFGEFVCSGMGGRTDRRLRMVLDAMPVAVSLASLESGRIIFMNRKFTQLFGYRVGDLATLHDWVQQAYPNVEHRDRAVKSWCAYFGTPSLDEFEIEPVEVDVRCSDGTIKTAIHGGMILPEPGWAMATFVDISERKRDELLIRQLAEEDVLTGLPNRRAFEGHLERAVSDARRDRQSMHLLVLDLDYFKEVNDRHGHQGGDLLLQAVAERLKACVRSSDLVARFGGDEFAIILGRSGSDANAGRICDKILEAVHRPFDLSGRQCHVGVSIGLARFPQDGRDAAALFEAADRALYRVKREGRGRWRAASEGPQTGQPL